MQRGRTGAILATSLILVLVSASWTLAYEILTHQAITLRAGEASGISQYLTDHLGLAGGLDAEFKGVRAKVWMAQGSQLEDDLLRFFFHFHDPLRSWDASGFGVGFLRSQSSIRWAQNEYQGWSWPKVRAYFLQALTAERAADRDQGFADTFRGLGQLIHLVQDAASPAHTRNDGHIAINYETVVLDAQRQLEGDPDRQWFVTLLANLRTPASGWQSLPSNSLAPAPIARLFDTDKYVGNNPAITTDSIIGLAEYTNANFFSEDRTFPKDSNFLFRYPYPAASSVQEADYPITLKTGDRVVRRYFTKIGDGETGYRLATVGFLRDYLQRYGLDPNRYNERHALDESVYKDYTERLLPRAVGYSAALLDYFFRGELDVRREADPETGLPSLAIVNRSPEPLGERGAFTLYQDNDQRLRRPVPRASLELTATVPKDNDEAPLRLPLPADLPEAGLTLVYEGPLGLEQKAVIGKALPEIAVEQVYRDWMTNEWILRTKDDLYVLPLETVAGLTAPLERVTWGDRDNQLVGVTAPDGADPYQALLFELDRPAGSVQVPLADTHTPEVPVVRLRLVQRIPLYQALGAIDLNTTVEFAGRLQFAQHMVTYTVTTTCDTHNPDPSVDHYECTTTVGGDTVAPVKNWSDTITARFSFQLTPEHHAPPHWDASHYRWSVVEARADRAGHIVAVVKVETTRLPEGEGTRTVPLIAMVFPTGELVEGDYAMTLGVEVSPAPWMAAVVDLTEGRLLAKTSADLITIERTDRVVNPGSGPFGAAVRYEVQYKGGPRDGDTKVEWGPTLGCVAYNNPTRKGLTLTDSPMERLDHIEGAFRTSLMTAGVGDVEPGVDEGGVSNVCYRFDLDGTAVMLQMPSLGLPPEISWSNWMRWTGPVPGRLRFEAHAWIPQDDVVRTRFVSWNLGTDQATLAHTATTDDPFRRVVGNASGAFASTRYEDYSLWISWRGGFLPFPDLDYWTARDYLALDPDYLYNVETGHFHELRPGLPEEAGPPPLAFGEEDEGEYHVVGR